MSFTTSEEVEDLDPVEIEKQEESTLSLGPIASGAAVVAGIASSASHTESLPRQPNLAQRRPEHCHSNNNEDDFAKCRNRGEPQNQRLPSRILQIRISSSAQPPQSKGQILRSS